MNQDNDHLDVPATPDSSSPLVHNPNGYPQPPVHSRPTLDPTTQTIKPTQGSSWFEVERLEGVLPPKVYQFVLNNVGLSLAALAHLFFACMNLTVKYFLTVTEISVPTLILVRMSVTLAGCIITLLIMRDPHPFLGPPEFRKLLVGRGIVGFLGLICSIMSFKGLKVSDSMAIQFLTPTCTLIVGYVVLKESFKKRELVAGLFCLVGVLFVSRPPIIFGRWAGGQDTPVEEGGGVALPGSDDEADKAPVEGRMIAVVWALCSVCAASFAYIAIRYIGQRASALHSMAYFAYACTIGSVITIMFSPGPFVWVKTWKAFILIMAAGVFGFIAQMLLTVGLQREKAGRATLAMYLSVIYTIVLELIFFQTLPSFLSLVGVSIILASAFLVARHTTSQEPPRPDDIESVPQSPTSPHSPTFGEHASTASSPRPSRSILSTRTNNNNKYEPVFTTDPDEADDGSEPADHVGSMGSTTASNGLRAPAQMPRRRSSASAYKSEQQTSNKAI